jgi:hypothetical protein
VTFVPILLLIGLCAGAYVAISRKAGRTTLRIGPRGRLWGLKLFVGMIVTLAVLVALILAVISYNHSAATDQPPVAPNDEQIV